MRMRSEVSRERLNHFEDILEMVFNSLVAILTCYFSLFNYGEEVSIFSIQKVVISCTRCCKKSLNSKMKIMLK